MLARKYDSLALVVFAELFVSFAAHVEGCLSKAGDVVIISQLLIGSN